MSTFSASHREQLGDARLLLDTALHNLRAALAEDEPEQALDNAVRMVAQVQSALVRVHAEHQARGQR